MFVLTSYSSHAGLRKIGRISPGMDTKFVPRLLHIMIWISALTILAGLIYLYLENGDMNNGFQTVAHAQSRMDVNTIHPDSKRINHRLAVKIQESIAHEQRGLCHQDLDVPSLAENVDLSQYTRCINVNFTVSRLNTDMLQAFSDPSYVARQNQYGKYNAKAPEIQQKIFEKMGVLVQGILNDLQSPGGCGRTRKVICSGNLHGFGSALHHITFCLMYAYATNRSLVLNTDMNPYTRRGWNRFVRPVNENCSSDLRNITHMGKANQDAEVISITMPPPSARFPRFSPPSMPTEILEMGRGLDFDIMAWWTGQFLSFVFRFAPELDTEIRKMAAKLGFQSPVVGIHIRRTDKLQHDANKFSVEEYMKHAERFYDKLPSGSRVTNKKVYLATDDPRVITEARIKYPSYTILADRDVAFSANPKQRGSEEGLKGIILDLYFLSQSDYLICTFSSNVCRAAYELKQSRLLNASGSTISLDCHHFFFKIFQLPRLALCTHIPQSNHEIGFAAGDLIYSYGTLNNEYSVGKNLNSSRKNIGIYPSHKVKSVLVPYGVNAV